MIITFNPTSKRAKDRIYQHGSKFNKLGEETRAGKRSILVESLEKTWKLNSNRVTKWMGWFTVDEIDFNSITEV